MRPITCFMLAALAAFFAPTATAADKDFPLGQMRISPDGRHVAALAYKDWKTVLVVTNLDDHAMRPLPNAPTGTYNLAWIDNDLLAINVRGAESYAINLKGEIVAKLGEKYIRTLPRQEGQGPRALVYRDLDDRQVEIVEIGSGKRTRIDHGLPGDVRYTVRDESGTPRAAQTFESSVLRGTLKFSNWYRASATAPWQLLEEFPVTDEPWWPIAILDEPGMIAVVSRQGRDNYAVFRYDTVHRKHLDVMAGHPTDDIVDFDASHDDSFLRVVTGGIKPTTHWFDPDWAALQKSVDAALPDRINTLSGNVKGRVLVHSYGDVDPGRWFVVDTVTSKFWQEGVALPDMDPARMRPMEIVRYDARDGLPIQGYLTRPAKQGPAPMVVLIHGGPQLRDTWSWNAEVQALATMGFAVFQPQFRGSTGFGARFERAGYMAWGRAMQDDITDGVQHLVAQGVADPKRVCIYGSSYGGYAALWGAIKTPELYRCAASFMGVTDLHLQASGSLLDDSTRASREINRVRLGDPEKHRAQLEEVSPLRHADRVGVPVFIAHGLKDTRVLPSHSRQMVEALRAKGKPVVWLPLEYLGHHEPEGATRRKYYKALFEFLERHLGPLDEPATGSAEAVKAASPPTAAASAPATSP